MITTNLVSPGEVLLEEFLRPMRISQYRLAIAIGVPESRINAIVKGRRAITADTDLRLCRFFGLSEGFWLRMQSSHDLRVAHRQLGVTLAQIQPWRLEVLKEVRGDVMGPPVPQNQA